MPTLDAVEFPVEQGKILEVARASHTHDPVHTNLTAARAAGFPAVVATATHVVVAAHHRDQATFVSDLGLDIARVVVGSVKWTYRRVLHSGDELRGTRVVVDRAQRTSSAGGTLTIIHLRTDYRDRDGKIAVTTDEQIIERPANAAGGQRS